LTGALQPAPLAPLKKISRISQLSFTPTLALFSCITRDRSAFWWKISFFQLLLRLLARTNSSNCRNPHWKGKLRIRSNLLFFPPKVRVHFPIFSRPSALIYFSPLCFLRKYDPESPGTFPRLFFQGRRSHLDESRFPLSICVLAPNERVFPVALSRSGADKNLTPPSSDAALTFSCTKKSPGLVVSLTSPIPVWATITTSSLSPSLVRSRSLPLCFYLVGFLPLPLPTAPRPYQFPSPGPIVDPFLLLLLRLPLPRRPSPLR